MSIDRPGCMRFEAALGDFRDGTLPAAEAADVRRHLSACPECAALHAAIGLAIEELRSLPAIEPPPNLVVSILARTSPHPHVSGPGAPARIPSLWAILASPRFGLGFAMALFASALVLNAAQINLRQLFGPGWYRAAASDFTPDALRSAGNRQISRLWASAVSYYHDLRVVYEIEAAINQTRQSQPPSQSVPERDRPAPSGANHASGHPNNFREDPS